MQYRKEIDGLRALAVLAVIFFHAGYNAFQGGYVGVDIFFVISGHLITSIILAEIDKGQFSFANFYERRARRILPALFAVMVVCLPFAWAWLPPPDLKSFLQSSAAVIIFSSNILFWNESGYFGTAAELKPLLHTWSLGVEEQYYVLFPLLLIALRHAKIRTLVLSLLALFVVSLGLAEWGARAWPEGAFFLLPTRFWELLAGGFTALALRHAPQLAKPSPISHLGSAAGLALLLASIFTFDADTRFPGLHALIPVMGTALVILFASERTWVGKLLAIRPLVTIGLISYSAYLWHQPLFAFCRHRSLNEPAPLLLGLLAVASLALGYLSWRFIEAPFRDRTRVSRQTIWRGAAAFSLMFLMLGAAGRVQNGFPERLPPDLATLANFKNDNAKARDDSCTPTLATRSQGEGCTVGAPDNVVGLLLGDSHAEMLWQPLNAQLRATGQGLISRTAGACPPIRGLYRIDLDLADCCEAFNEETWALLQANPQWHTVVLSPRWTIYAERTRYDNGEGGKEAGKAAPVGVERNGQRIEAPETTRRDQVLQRYTEGIQELLATGRRVVLIYPVPEVGWVVPTHYWKSRMFAGLPENGTISHSFASFEKRNEAVIKALDAVGQHPKLIRIRPERVLCNQETPGRCLAVDKGRLLYADDDHLSNTGAAPIASLVTQALHAPTIQRRKE